MIDQLEPRRMLSAGDLDPTFGVRGVVSVDNFPRAAISQDGSITYATRDAAGAIEVAQLSPSGRPDPAFGNAGGVPVGISDFTLSQLVNDPSTGRIAVIGIQQLPTTRALVVEMLSANGQLDRTFDGDAQAVIRDDFETSPAGTKLTEAAFATGNLYVGVTVNKNSSDVGTPNGAVIYRYTRGGLDPTFGDAGAATPFLMDGVTSLVPQRPETGSDGQFHPVGERPFWRFESPDSCANGAAKRRRVRRFDIRPRRPIYECRPRCPDHRHETYLAPG